MTLSSLRKLSELYDATPKSMTKIQLDNAIKPFIGKDIEIRREIRDITNIRLDLVHKDGYFGLIITYDKVRFENALQEYKKGDKIIVIAKLNSFDSNLGHLYLNLTSLSKEPPQPIPASFVAQPPKPKTGCFVATVCYGDYNAPEVLVLRKFRDDKLLPYISGKFFVKLYYLVSPFFVSLISNSTVLRNSIRRFFLQPIVTKIKRKTKY